MVRKYKIVHLITRLDLGGAQQNTLHCVRHHDRERFDVELVAGRGGVLDAEARAIADAGIHIVPYLKHAISPWSDVAALFRLRSHFRSRGVDLVHTHSSKAGIVGRLAAFLAGVPVVVHTAHGWSFNRTQPGGVRRGFVMLERMAAPITDRLIMVSRSNLDEGLALRIGRAGQYAVVRSGIDAAEFRAAGRDRDAVRAELGCEPHHVLVGTVACLKPQKGPLDFVRAAAAAHARSERLRFVMAGDGELRAEVETLARQLGLGDVLRVLGWRRDVAELLRAMDVFLLTSRFEGLPRVVLQAMASGVPVVATAVDGTPEVVRDGRSGLLVPPESPETAADRVLELVADPELRRRCVDEASRVLDGSFDIHRMVRDLEGIYISLLKGEDRPMRMESAG
jgi:glycosyltransferase involved in cell wall biosynthesis